MAATLWKYNYERNEFAAGEQKNRREILVLGFQEIIRRKNSRQVSEKIQIKNARLGVFLRI